MKQDNSPPIAKNHTIVTLQKFLELDASSGILLMVAAISAMFLANFEATAASYQHFLHSKLTIGFEGAKLTYSLEHWINDGLMVIFFFFVGMGIKYELMEGQLADRKSSILPLIAAIGGVITPALIFAAFNYNNPEILRGWAIPTATDIAFAVGVVSLFGNRAPLGLKIFILAVAVIDDLIAVLIIAFFYTANIDVNALILAAACAFLLGIFNCRKVHIFSPYIIIGAIMWLAVLKSGVHATIAGVILGVTIPLHVKDATGKSMLKRAEHAIAYWVNHLILPIFAFANAGVVLGGMELSDLKNNLPLGVACGLFFGKQIGVFSASYLMIKSKTARLPEGATWLQFYAICMMCGIGFTMSLFVGTLSYNQELLLSETKLGVMLGSITSAICSYMLLNYALKKSAKKAQN
jgi:Na+:H+ antiporter, NhaA family